ncbi:protein DROOPING LEAF-like [Canna indica]|uniref:Protein DROOPING LEAF-like n=1 Tax=Canna indica TaxID=4628 RepID=A0AAQ3K6U1_9LILI|nr:protein DROOPING LEAF-like [Canna indica]
MDLVCSTEHICYVRCTYCNTLLAVGVPCNWLMDRVTVNCGHCNNLSFLNPSHMVQCVCPTSHQSMMPKKHRAPSAYNHFMRDEIQRIKAANPEIPHREAFSMAAKNVS